MSHFGRKVAVAAVAFAAVGSTVFGGAALADDKKDGHDDKKDVKVSQDASARGGDACNDNLINIPVSVGLGLGLLGEGEGKGGDQCNGGDASAANRIGG